MTDDAVSEEGTADHRERAYAQLVALRETLNKIDVHVGLRTNYVDDFRQALDHLRAAGEDVEEYRIPDDWIERPRTERDPRARLNRTPSAPKPPTIRNHYLMTRVNAVLGYFTLKAAVERDADETGTTLQRLIGFETPPA